MIKTWLKHIGILVFPHRWEKNYYLPTLTSDAASLDKLGWEPEISLLKELLVPKEGLFIDIGANIGQYSYAAMHVIGSENVIAFEPLEDTAYYVFSKRGPFHKPNWVHWSNFAISNHKNEVPIYIPKMNGLWKYSQASLYAQRFTEAKIPFKTQSIKMITLDSYLENLPTKSNPKVQMVKIDIEGAELEAIQGMTKLINSQSPILQIEIEERHNKEFYKVFHTLMEYGYQHCFQLDKSDYKLKEIPYPSSMEGTISNNFYFKK